MSKTIKDNPYKVIRKPIPRPGHVINSKKDYDRSKAKQEMKEIIEESIEDCDDNLKHLCESIMR